MVFPAPGTSWDEDLPANVDITSPLNGSKIASGTTMTISASPTDANGIRKVEFFRSDVQTAVGILGTVTAAPWSYNWSNVPTGDYKIFVKVYDNRGTSRWSNATSVSVSPGTSVLKGRSGICIPANAIRILGLGGDNLIISVDAPGMFNIDIFSLLGRIIACRSGQGSKQYVIPIKSGCGVVILRGVIGNSMFAKKIVLK